MKENAKNLSPCDVSEHGTSQRFMTWGMMAIGKRDNKFRMYVLRSVDEELQLNHAPAQA